MTMLNAGHMEASMAPKNAMRIDPDADGDNDTEQVVCPKCGAQFAPSDTDSDAMQMAQGQPGAAPPAPQPQMQEEESSCPECGAKMEGGECAACGYSATHSPMTDAASRYLSTKPKDQRPPVKDVVDQGRRVREHMRRPAPFGRG